MWKMMSSKVLLKRNKFWNEIIDKVGRSVGRSVSKLMDCMNDQIN